MKKDGYYSSGEFARMAGVTLRTIRYYDKLNLLPPSHTSPSGARFYSEADMVRLQQILLFKYLGFSLEEIRQMTIAGYDPHFLKNDLRLQLSLIRDKIEQMQLVEQAITDTMSELDKNPSVDWKQMLRLIHLTGMEKSLLNQYEDASNISSRIQLHNLYSKNTEGWFPFIFRSCGIREGMRILEVGCGDGTIWSLKKDALPEGVSIVLSDSSPGMIRDARRRIGPSDPRFSFCTAGAESLPFKDGEFDLILANHVLFYLTDLPAGLKELSRVLKRDGALLASAYGRAHMQEVSRLVRGFDERIVLSASALYERFGKENGAALLGEVFSRTDWIPYEDALLVTEAEPLIAYILSCHGNQNQYLLDRYQEFKGYVRKKVQGGFPITKDAGLFCCRGKKSGKKKKSP